MILIEVSFLAVASLLSALLVAVLRSWMVPQTGESLRVLGPVPWLLH